MARSYGAVKTEVWDPGSDFRTLTVPAQWAYTMLLSQPQITNCGVLPYLPDKWVRLADGLTRSALDWALLELRQTVYIAVDEVAGELLVRTFIKHDRVWKQPNLAKNACREHRAVESGLIRQILAAMYPWLLDETAAAGLKDADISDVVKPLPEPLREALLEPLPKPLREPPNARATRADLPLNLPPNQPQKRLGEDVGGAESPTQQAAATPELELEGEETEEVARARDPIPSEDLERIDPETELTSVGNGRVHDESGMKPDRKGVVGPGLKARYTAARGDAYVTNALIHVPANERAADLRYQFPDIPDSEVHRLLDQAADLERQPEGAA